MTMDMHNDSIGLHNNSTHGNDSLLDLPPYWKLPTRVILSGLMIVFMVFAIIGNFLVIIVIARHRGMRTRTNMFLCNLAIADFLCAILCMPVSLTTMIKGEWIFGSYTGWFCQFNGFLMPLFFVTSIHTLMYISVHKYISITRPFSRVITYRRILVMIVLAWAFAALTGYLTIHGLNKVLYKPYTTQCGPDYPHDLRTFFLPLHTTLTCYIIPFTIIIVCYVLMFREIRAHGVRLELHSNKEKQAIFIQQRRITFTLFMVLIVFVITWTPYILYSVYVSVLKDKNKAPAVINAVSYWFGYMNSACNPIIYALRSPAFRDGYMEILCGTRAVIVSEETEPWVSSPGPLGKLRTYMRNTLTNSQRSHDYSDTSQNGVSSQLSGKHKTLSTSSLPETIKHRYNISGAKVTTIGGNQVITIGGKIVCFKDKSKKLHGFDKIKSPHSLPENVPITQSIIKKSPRQDGRRVSFHESAIGGTMDTVPEPSSDPVTFNVDASDNTENSNSIVQHFNKTPPDLSAEEKLAFEDDNVFVSISLAEATPLQTPEAPRIQITSENNDVFFVGDINDLLNKKTRVYHRSISEQQTEEMNTNSNAVARSTSDNCLSKDTPNVEPEKSPRTRNFLKWFYRAKKSDSSTESSCSPKSPKENRHFSFLHLPNFPHNRSYSDSGNDTSDNASQYEETLSKVKSDTVVYSEENANKRSWFMKFATKKVTKSDSHISGNKGDRKRPSLMHYPSVEKLDRIPGKKKKKRQKSSETKAEGILPELSSYTVESWMDETMDEFQTEAGLLNRTLSDPCIPVSLLERHACLKAEIRLERHSFRKEKPSCYSSVQCKDILDTQITFNDFHSLQSTDV